MATNIKNLLKKGKLTGHEVGQLMIKDLAKSYKNILENKGDEGLLTFEDKMLLVDGLKKSEDIKRYNEFRHVHEFLITAPILFSLYEKTASNAFWKIYHLLREAQQAEREYTQEKHHTPCIVTQKQYDDLKQADFNKKIGWSYSVENLLLYSVDYYFDQYKAGKKTPFDKYFTASKEQPITNPRIKENYWEDNGYYTLPDGRKSKDMSREEWVEALNEYEAYAGMIEATRGGELTGEEILINKQIRDEADKPPLEWTSDNTAPEDATMFDVLEYLSGFYSSEETDNQDTIFEFMTDFPDLYNAIWEHITKMKGLFFLKEIPKEQYFDTDLIKCKDLYDNNILDFREYLETLTLEDTNGIAILQQSGATYPKHNIDENGYYKEKDHYWRNYHMADALLKDHGEDIELLLRELKLNYKYAYAMKEAIKIIGNFIGVRDINILLGDIKESEITSLNMAMEHLTEEITRRNPEEGEMTETEIINQLKELLQPIRIKDLKPRAKDIKTAKEMIDFSTVQGSAIKFLSLLAGEDGEQWE